MLLVSNIIVTWLGAISDFFLKCLVDGLGYTSTRVILKSFEIGDQWFSQRTFMFEVAGSIPAPFIVESS